MRYLTLTLALIATTALASTAVMARDHDGKGPDGPRPDFEGKMMEKIDTDGDGKVSKAESAAFHAERFAEMDENKDDFLERKEMKAAKEKMREKMQYMREKRQEGAKSAADSKE